MGLETNTNTPLRVEPNMFVGNSAPVVEPRAVSALSQAFREGLITANDVADRIAQKPAKAAALELASRPDLVQAKAQQELNASAQSGVNLEASQFALANQKMMAAIPMNVREMQKELGTWTVRTDPMKWTDVDSAEVTRRWGKMQQWKTYQAQVAGERDMFDPNGQTIETKDARGNPMKVSVAVTKTSRLPVDQSRVNDLEKFLIQYPTPQSWEASGSPAPKLIFGGTPGAVESAPAQLQQVSPQVLAGGVPATPGPAPLPTNPAAPVTITVQPQAAPVSAPLFSGTAAGVQGLVIQEPGAGEMKSPSELQVKSANFQARFLNSNEVFQNLAAEGFDPGSFPNWIQSLLVGPLSSFKTSDMRSFEAAKSSWSQGLLRLESGAAISAKEQSWYEKTFFPTGLEPKAVQDEKASMRADVEKIAAAVAAGGHLDVPALVAVNSRADQLDRLTQKGALFNSGESRVITLPSGKQMRLIGNDPATMRVVPVNSLTAPKIEVRGYVPPVKLAPLGSKPEATKTGTALVEKIKPAGAKPEGF